jgi:(p)ppGpp synthase/HD superfamily hydrolase
MRLLEVVVSTSQPEQRLEVARFDEAGRELIVKAEEISREAHESYRRLEGKPYFSHALAVAQLLLEWHAPARLVAAALLHDVMNSSYAKPPSHERITKACGVEVARLVEASAAFSRFGAKYPSGDRYQRLESVERISEVFPEVAASFTASPLALVIRMANHLDNARSIELVEQDERDHFARVALNILAPLASRLGMQAVRRDLEDIGFKILAPQAYSHVGAFYQPELVDARAVPVIEALEAGLLRDGLRSNVLRGPRSHYSLYGRRLDLEPLGVTLAPHESAYPYMVIVATAAECYQALGVLHGLYTPLQAHFFDYIALPKMNDYRSLHTRLRTQPGSEIEVIIRDSAMHRVAEGGITAKWEDFSKIAVEMTPGVSSTNLVQVFTPTGEIKALPVDSTAIDFAFGIHKEIGFQCIGAVVNGVDYPLDRPLPPLSTVQILVGAASIGPSTEWLRTTKTPFAISEIQKFYAVKQPSAEIDRGRELLSKALATRKLTHSFSELANRLNIGCRQFETTVAGLLQSIADGTVALDAAAALFEFEDPSILATKKLRGTQTVVTISARDRTGLAADVLDVARGMSIGIETIAAHRTHENGARVKLSVGDVSPKALERLVAEVRRVDGVIGVTTSTKEQIPVVESGPYTLDPATGPRFKGRKQEIAELAEYMETSAQVVLVWGPRRIGKTSLLVELPDHLERSGLIPVSITLQDRKIHSTFELLDAIIKSLMRFADDVNMPKWSTLKKNPLYSFDSFVKRALPDRSRAVLIIDEFQIISQLEERRENSVLSRRDLLTYFRNQAQLGKKIGMILSGGGILSELTLQEDVSALFELARFMELDFLRRSDAERIITDTDVSYEPAAVDQILQLTSNPDATGNHPGYIQLICKELALRFGTSVSLSTLNEWLEKDLPLLPRHFFSNLWGVWLGLQGSDRAKCLAVLSCVVALQKTNEWATQNDIARTEVGEMMPRATLAKTLAQLEALRTIVKNPNAPTEYRTKMPLTALWLSANYTLAEILADHGQDLGA